MLCNAGTCFNPSIADVTEIGGVIIPSASKAAPPIIAGITSHFFVRLTNANREKMPPSPLLSARNVKITYFIVVCKVSVQIIRESTPIINSSDTVSYTHLRAHETGRNLVCRLLLEQKK